MKMKKSFEEAICILLYIGSSQKKLKSHELSDKLGVSDSYLKKILRKLVLSDLVESKASKHGGFVLAKPLEDITLFDVFKAVEGYEHFVSTTHLVNKVFDDSLNIKETEMFIVDHLNEAEKEYKNKLKEITLAHIIKYAHKGD